MARSTRAITVKLPPDLDEALATLARTRKSTRSALVREALEALAYNKLGSVTSAVDQLIGPLEGPADLATNPKHMTGYGE